MTSPAILPTIHSPQDLQPLSLPKLEVVGVEASYKGGQTT